MKTTELTLSVLAVVAFILNLLVVSFGSVLVVVSLSLLSLFYFYLGFALFNDVPLQRLFKKDSYQGTSTQRIAGGIATGIGITIVLTGVLFKIQTWPGANTNIASGLVVLSAILVISVIMYLKTSSVYYTRILKRIAIYGALGVVLLLLPKYTILEFKYRNYPGYVEAVKKAQGSPGNPGLWQKVDEERQKIHQNK